MKMLAYLLITASLIVGAITASTAYLVDIGTPDAANNALLPADGSDNFAKLSSPAGKYDPHGDFELVQAIKRYQDGEDTYQEEQERAVELMPAADASDSEGSSGPELEALDMQPTGETLLARREAVLPIGRTGDRVTEDLLGLLRERDVRSVRVSKFSAERWFGKAGRFMGWGFLASAFGLFVGAMVVRRATKQEIAATRETGGDERAGASAAFAQINNALETLQRDLAGVREPRVRNAMIVERIGVIQRDYAPAFVADRPALIGSLGLGGFAELMDRFAALERQMNRAWSAAADEHEDEAITSLYRALAIMPEVAQKLPQ
ncbi:MAG: hypothetical protein KDA20_06110 [Phycisphaerales bacterium]|nr:hypothetical protein [Phycisphaerales bacterium]